MPDTASKQWIQSYGNVVSVPTEAWAENYGGPKYPKLFIEDYSSTGVGISVTWTSPIPVVSPTIYRIFVRDRTDGCYVQSTPPVNPAATIVDANGNTSLPLLTSASEGVVITAGYGTPIFTS